MQAAQLRFSLPSRAGVAGRAVALQLAMRAWGARHAVVFPLAMRAGVAGRADALQLAMRAGVAGRAVALHATMGCTSRSRFSACHGGSPCSPRSCISPCHANTVYSPPSLTKDVSFAATPARPPHPMPTGATRCDRDATIETRSHARARRDVTRARVESRLTAGGRSRRGTALGSRRNRGTRPEHVSFPPPRTPRLPPWRRRARSPCSSSSSSRS